MKELTIQEKAERYNKAYKVAENIHKCSSNPAEIKRMEQIFPELIESEDEMVREAIISGMTALKEQGKETFAAIHINDCIAWLEKQGEKKELKKIEDKPAWSEEDDYMLESIISDFAAGHKSSIGQEKWLKFLKERVQPQSKQEWSEEDVNALNRIIAILVDASEVKNWWKEYRLIEKDEMIRLTNFLKSLKFKNTWKPSDEQLKALEAMLTVLPQSPVAASALIELYQQLKKLREE